MKKYVSLLAICLLAVLSSCVKDDPLYDPEQATAAGVNLKPARGEKLYTFSLSANGGAESLPSGFTPSFKVGMVFGVYDVIEGKVQRFMTCIPTGTSSTALQGLGVMSNQRFTTKAITPVSAVSVWTSANDYSIEVPREQIVPAGDRLDPKAPVYMAEVNTSNTTISFKSIVSFVKFSVSNENVSSVEFMFNNDSEESDTYKMTMEEGSFVAGRDYYLVVNPGEYKGVYVIEKTGSSSQGFYLSDSYSFEAGKATYDIGTFDSKASTWYRITSEQNVQRMTNYLNGILLFENLDAGMKSLAQTVLNMKFTSNEQNSAARIINYEYASVGPDGNPVTLSSALILPYAAYRHDTPVKKIVLGNHFSSMKNVECPTMSNNVEGLVAWKNVAAVLPDYYGFGSSSQYCQAYLNPDMSGRCSADALLAALQIMADNEYAIPDGIVNMGYSQGGYNAVANLKYLSEHPSYDVTFEQTFAGGGPYDVFGTFNEYISGGYGNVFPLVLVTLTSFNELEHLGVSYSDIFKGKLLENYQEWVLDKKYSTSEVISLLGDTYAVNHLTDALTSGTDNEIINKFKDVADRYSLTKGWTPQPGTKIRLYHSEYDDMVPYSNQVALESYLEDKCDLQVKSYSESGKTHVVTYLFFLMDILDYLK